MKVETFLGEYEISRLEVGKTINGRMMITLYEWNKEYNIEEEFATITKNFPEINIKENEAFVDMNNCPWAKRFIEDYGLGEDTGEKTKSGYCTYPLYKFNIEVLERYEVKR